jgi:hypothetical protein
MTQRRRKLVLWLFGVLATLGVAYGVLVLIVRHPLPEGEEGAAADALARAIEARLGAAAWAETMAVRFTFRSRHEHLWDRARNLARVRSSAATVLLDLATRKGRAWRNDRELEGADLSTAIERAYGFWANDSFWLAAPFKLFDPGTRRFAVSLADGRRALLVRYSSGGVTPGDAYLWILDAEHRPTSWRMWASILPVGGLEVKIRGYERLATGAEVANQHSLLGLLDVGLTNVAGARTLAELEPGADPFAPIAPRR